MKWLAVTFVWVGFLADAKTKAFVSTSSRDGTSTALQDHRSPGFVGFSGKDFGGQSGGSYTAPMQGPGAPAPAPSPSARLTEALLNSNQYNDDDYYQGYSNHYPGGVMDGSGNYVAPMQGPGAPPPPRRQNDGYYDNQYDGPRDRPRYGNDREISRNGDRNGRYYDDYDNQYQDDHYYSDNNNYYYPMEEDGYRSDYYREEYLGEEDYDGYNRQEYERDTRNRKRYPGEQFDEYPEDPYNRYEYTARRSPSQSRTAGGGNFDRYPRDFNDRRILSGPARHARPRGEDWGERVNSPRLSTMSRRGAMNGPGQRSVYDGLSPEQRSRQQRQDDFAHGTGNRDTYYAPGGNARW